LETGRRKAYPVTVRKLAAGLDVEPRLLLGGVEYADETEPPEGPAEEREEKGKIGF
jgi:hypothetical protein